MRVDYRAAWVPFDHDNGQTPALLALAVDWVERECAEQRTSGLLIVSKKPISDYPRFEATTQIAAINIWLRRLVNTR